MENTKIFDENGNSLHISDVIYDFIEKKSKELNIDSDEIALGIDDHSNTLDVHRIVENSYDSCDVEYVEEIKTTKSK